MTYGDLKRQILNLGFETSDGYEEEASIIPDACNLAMRDITTLFPLIGRYTLCQAPLRTILSGGHGQYDGTTPLLFAAEGARALYVECTGSGLLTITDDDGTRYFVLSAQGGLQAYRAFVRGSVQLSFAGPFSYDVQNLALYGEIRSDRAEDIPAFRRYARYDLLALTREQPDETGQGGRDVFCGFWDKVQERDASGTEVYRSIRDFRIEQPATIVLDGFVRAQYTFFYKRAFVPFSVTTRDETALELPFAQQHLLPLLASYYIWLDDDLTKASLYYNKYEESRTLLIANDNETVATVESWGDL